jgi:tryptophan 2,3-dioxygenase
MSSNKPPSDLTYSKYLKVDELISLQKPLTNPVAHDEMLFITIHQVYELWFKLILWELENTMENMNSGSLLASYRDLDRVCEIFRVLIQQIDILETMTPVDFNKFRSNLNPASGFQSGQFRELELLAGADISEYEKFFELEPEWKARLKARGAKPNLRTVFSNLLVKRGLMKDASRENLVEAIKKIYDDPKLLDLQTLCEYLIRFDEQISLWRFRHVQMVERMIGMRKGTGGSLGVPYLQSTLKKRFFPELWEARTHLGGTY